MDPGRAKARGVGLWDLVGSLASGRVYVQLSGAVLKALVTYPGPGPGGLGA